MTMSDTPFSPAPDTSPKTNLIDWNASHLGRPVRFKDKSRNLPGQHYRLEALRYEARTGTVAATLVAVEPSARPGTVVHHGIDCLELVEPQA